MIRPGMTCGVPDAAAGIATGCPGTDEIAISRKRTSAPVESKVDSFRFETVSDAPGANMAVDKLGAAGAEPPFAGAAAKNSASIFVRTSACSELTRAVGRTPGVPGCVSAGVAWPGTLGVEPGSAIGAPEEAGRAACAGSVAD